jgi:plasmid maintenance system antidote protein VapI
MLRTPAERFPVSIYIIGEVAERGWTLAEFTAMTGYPRETIVSLLYDEVEPDAEMCLALALVFETSPDLWENLRKAAKP